VKSAKPALQWPLMIMDIIHRAAPPPPSPRMLHAACCIQSRARRCDLSESLYLAGILLRIARMTPVKIAPLKSISHPCDPGHPCPFCGFAALGSPFWIFHFALWIAFPGPRARPITPDCARLRQR
jgi:hypothetical protein